MKDFAIKTGVTIILATHSPFLIDMDHLDEIRVVKNIEGKVFIQNDFSVINADDSDVLSTIKHALTVRTHILCDPDKQIVFVEGITDYNIFTKVARILGKDYQNFSFLPVNGIGNDKDSQKKLLSGIMRMAKKRDPALLVDGDKAGEAIKALNGDNKDLLVISLSEIDTSFKEMESLFAEEDRIKMGIQKGSREYIKSSILSSNIKNYRSCDDFSEKTMCNFQKVLDYIINQIS